MTAEYGNQSYAAQFGVVGNDDGSFYYACCRFRRYYLKIAIALLPGCQELNDIVGCVAYNMVTIEFTFSSR